MVSHGAGGKWARCATALAPIVACPLRMMYLLFTNTMTKEQAPRCSREDRTLRPTSTNKLRDKAINYKDRT